MSEPCMLSTWLLRRREAKCILFTASCVRLLVKKRSEYGCDMRRFRSFNHSACKTVLNLLEAIYLILRKIVVERVTVVMFRVGNRGSRWKSTVVADQWPVTYFRFRVTYHCRRLTTQTTDLYTYSTQQAYTVRYNTLPYTAEDSLLT